jgi:ComF family protein
MAITAGVSSFARSLLDLVFPPHCVNCHTLGALLCERCRATIAFPQPPVCAHCGRPLLTPRSDHQCEMCASGHGPVHLTSLRAATVYDGSIRAAILAYKFRGARRRAEPLSKLLVSAYKHDGLAADQVTHVPLHSARRRQRVYDQSQLLAREAARRLGLPFLPDAVKRVRATEPQTSLQGNQRILNVAQALALANVAVIPRVKNRRILLIDDVTATGSTLDATAAALAEGVPAAIIGLALSRPNGNSIS